MDSQQKNLLNQFDRAEQEAKTKKTRLGEIERDLSGDENLTDEEKRRQQRLIEEEKKKAEDIERKAQAGRAAANLLLRASNPEDLDNLNEEEREKVLRKIKALDAGTAAKASQRLAQMTEKAERDKKAKEEKRRELAARDEANPMDNPEMAIDNLAAEIGEISDDERTVLRAEMENPDNMSEDFWRAGVVALIKAYRQHKLYALLSSEFVPRRPNYIDEFLLYRRRLQEETDLPLPEPDSGGFEDDVGQIDHSPEAPSTFSKEEILERLKLPERPAEKVKSWLDDWLKDSQRPNQQKSAAKPDVRQAAEKKSHDTRKMTEDLFKRLSPAEQKWLETYPRTDTILRLLRAKTGVNLAPDDAAAADLMRQVRERLQEIEKQRREEIAKAATNSRTAGDSANNVTMTVDRNIDNNLSAGPENTGQISDSDLPIVAAGSSLDGDSDAVDFSAPTLDTPSGSGSNADLSATTLPSAFSKPGAGGFGGGNNVGREADYARRIKNIGQSETPSDVGEFKDWPDFSVGDFSPASQDHANTSKPNYANHPIGSFDGSGRIDNFTHNPSEANWLNDFMGGQNSVNQSGRPTSKLENSDVATAGKSNSNFVKGRNSIHSDASGLVENATLSGSSEPKSQTIGSEAKHNPEAKNQKRASSYSLSVPMDLSGALDFVAAPFVLLKHRRSLLSRKNNL